MRDVYTFKIALEGRVLAQFGADMVRTHYVPPKIHALDISGPDVEEAMRPLPRNREIFPSEELRAEEQRRKRDGLVRLLARKFAEAFAELIESEDTINGYHRHEAPELFKGRRP